MGANRSSAIFIDRDGVLNQLIYVSEHGRVETPLNPSQFSLMPHVRYAFNTFRTLGLKILLVSNQPGIAKGQFDESMFEQIRSKMHVLLRKQGVSLDGEYYCLHHPNAIIKSYRINCDCRKPKAGLILKAASEHRIDLNSSYVIGDGLTDIEAGKISGCKTILIGHISSLLLHLLRRKKIQPNYIAENLREAANYARATLHEKTDRQNI